MESVLKTDVGNTTGGSNPSPSAISKKEIKMLVLEEKAMKVVEDILSKSGVPLNKLKNLRINWKKNMVLYYLIFIVNFMKRKKIR